LVEAFTYRMGAHTTSDDPTRYRPAAELDQWRAKDPIDRVRAYLTRSGAADQAFLVEVEAEADRLAAEVRRVTHELPEPDPDRMFEHAYSAEHPLVDDERDWLRRYRSSFEDQPASEADPAEGRPPVDLQPAAEGSLR
jgi:2-oxoisovalerate dehydrogenase E1 component alpha subunit